MWRISLALKYLFPRKLSFFTAISIAGISIGVMVLIVVNSVMSGFSNEIRTKLIQTNGSAKIISKDGIINAHDIISREVSLLSNVSGVSKFASGIVFVQHEKYVWFPKILGVDTTTITSVIPLKDFIKDGDLSFMQPSNILLSRFLANNLGAQIGSKIDVYSPLMMEALNNDEILLPKELTVVGIFETGWAEIDRDTIICQLSTMQELYGLGNGIHGIMLNVKGDTKSLTEFCKLLNDKLPENLRAQSWIEMNEDFLYVLKLERTISLFVVLFVVIVAAFSISSGLMTSVVRKTKEIAILHVLGASKFDIIAVFCSKAAVLGILGSFFGTISGLLLIHFRDNIMQTLLRYVLPSDILWKFYSFSKLPAHYTLSDLIIICTTTILITLISGLIPAWRAGLYKPAKCLKEF